MKYCTKCGAELHDEAVVCPNCGCKADAVDDSGSIGWGFLGFIIPIVGLILYLTWKNEKPKCAKRAGSGALAAVIIDALGVLGYLAIIFALI